MLIFQTMLVYYMHKTTHTHQWIKKLHLEYIMIYNYINFTITKGESYITIVLNLQLLELHTSHLNYLHKIFINYFNILIRSAEVHLFI